MGATINRLTIGKELVLSQGRSLWQWLREHPRELLYIALSFYVFWNFFRPMPEHPGRALFVLLVFVALFLMPSPPGRSRYLRWVDYLLVILTIVCFSYILPNWHDIAWRLGNPTLPDMIMGLIAIGLSVEAARRGMGWLLAGVVIAFLLYYFLGHYLPRELAGHAPFDLKRIVSAVYLSTDLDGIFGTAAYVMMKYVFLIYMFGKSLEMTGATTYLIDLARGIVGTIRGGPALVSVVGSSFVGSITGLATANVLITGVVTIPLMKKTGFKPEVAGGVEAAASSGGILMPPIMGLASFLMMAFLGVPYIFIIKAALLPAILYFCGIAGAVLFYSRGTKVGVIPRSEVPRLKEVLKRREGITFLGGFSVLVSLIAMRYSPTLAAIIAMGFVFVLSFVTPHRMTPKRLITLLIETARDFLRLGGIIGGIGLVIGTSLSTGLAYRLTDVLLGFTGGALAPTLALTLVACIILGMGLPPLVIYIIAVVLMAPALTALGISPMAAHLFCFYGSVLSEVTPPVAMSAYVAATLAGSKFWKVCVNGMRFAIAAYIIPFAFVLDDSLLLMGDLTRLPLAFGTALVGVVLLSNSVASLSSSLVGHARRLFFFVAAILLVLPILHLTPVGVAMGLAGGAMMLLERRLEKRAISGSAGQV